MISYIEAPLSRMLQVVLLSLLLTACGSTMLKTQNDNPNSIYGFPNGQVSYFNEGADFVTNQRKEDALNKARQFCSERKVVLLSENHEKQNGTIYLPQQQAVNTSGNINGLYGPISYNQQTTYTTQTPLNFSNDHVVMGFLCADPDVDQMVYVLSSKSLEDVPVCTKVESKFAPGRSRIERVAEDPSSDECIQKQGWLRFYDSVNGKKSHIFVGDSGKELCKRLETDLLDKNVKAGETNAFLRKSLVCR